MDKLRFYLIIWAYKLRISQSTTSWIDGPRISRGKSTKKLQLNFKLKSPLNPNLNSTNSANFTSKKNRQPRPQTFRCQDEIYLQQNMWEVWSEHLQKVLSPKRLHFKNLDSYWSFRQSRSSICSFQGNPWKNQAGSSN